VNIFIFEQFFTKNRFSYIRHKITYFKKKRRKCFYCQWCYFYIITNKLLFFWNEIIL